jgi:hypothetical protein
VPRRDAKEQERPIAEPPAALAVESVFVPRERLAVDVVGVVWAGFLATLAITIVLYAVPPVLGLPPFDVAATLGTMVVPRPGPLAWGLGMTWHFVNGVLFTLAYAAVLLAIGRQSTWRTGLALGAGLWLVGPMLAMPVLLRLHLLVRAGEMPNPGFFMLDMGYGWTPAAFDLAAHLLFGYLVGVVYKHRVL